MYGDTVGNATDERSKETDRSRSDYSKRPKDDARKDSQDGRKYEGKPFLLDFIGFWVLVG